MKRITTFGFALLFSLFVAPAWAHHAAEGIISYDLWDMIDENLDVVDSLHLNIDFEDAMGSMRTGSSDEGVLSLITTVTVRTDEVELYMTAIDVIIEQYLANLVETGQVSPGALENGHSSWFYFTTVDLGDGYFEIQLVEPVGQGASQDLEPTPWPGNGEGKGN